jgi:hypothetical protein
MAIKRNPASEPLVSAGAAPLREKRKHSPAKRSPDALESTPVAAGTGVEPESNSVVTGNPDVTEFPPFDEIAKLAYSYWEARGGQGGQPEEDWLRAEQELRSRWTSARA